MHGVGGVRRAARRGYEDVWMCRRNKTKCVSEVVERGGENCGVQWLRINGIMRELGQRGAGGGNFNITLPPVLVAASTHIHYTVPQHRLCND